MKLWFVENQEGRQEGCCAPGEYLQHAQYAAEALQPLKSPLSTWIWLLWPPQALPPHLPQLSSTHTEQPLISLLVLKIAQATLYLKVSLLAIPSTCEGPALDILMGHFLTFFTALLKHHLSI